MFLLCRKFYGIKNTFSKKVMLINLIIWYFLFYYGCEVLKFIVKSKSNKKIFLNLLSEIIENFSNEYWIKNNDYIFSIDRLNSC